MHKRKPVPITHDRLESDDYYRAQVQLPDKMTWAAAYNAVYDFNPLLAGQLRDVMGKAVQEKLLEHFRTLLAGSPQFQMFFKLWTKEFVDLSVRKEFNEWLRRNNLSIYSLNEFTDHSSRKS